MDAQSKADDTISSVRNDAPDGGWGWFIVLSAHISEAFVDGMIASTAVLLVRMKTYFNEGAGRISLIASIGLFVFHCSGKIHICLNKLKCKQSCGIITPIKLNSTLAVLP